MIHRTRLAIAGASLTIVSFLIYLGLTWSDYQDDLDASRTSDFERVPTYWRYLRNGLTFSTQLLIVSGIVMILVAAAMRAPHDDDRMSGP